MWMICQCCEISSKFGWYSTTLTHFPFLDSDLTWPVNKANPLYFISSTDTKVCVCAYPECVVYGGQTLQLWHNDSVGRCASRDLLQLGQIVRSVDLHTLHQKLICSENESWTQTSSRWRYLPRYQAPCPTFHCVANTPHSSIHQVMGWGTGSKACWPGARLQCLRSTVTISTHKMAVESASHTLWYVPGK